MLAAAVVAAGLVPAGPATAAHTVVVDGDGTIGTTGCDGTLPAPRSVTAALAGDRDATLVRVCPGSVVEPGQVVVDRDLSVRAFDPDHPPVLRPGADTGTTGDDRGWWLVRPGTRLSLRDLRLDGTGHRIHQAVRFRGAGEIRDVAFADIAYDPSGPDHSGFAVVAFGDGPVTVASSTFRRIGRVGALFFGAQTAGSVFDGNLYVGKGAGPHLDYGVEIGAGARVTVSDSRISAARGEAEGAVSAGVLVSTAFGGGSALELTRSTLVDNANGVFVDDAGGSGLGTVRIARNRIEGSAVLGIARAGAGAVDATCNWWGAEDGPRTSGGSGDGVTGGVQTAPFLTSEDLAGRCDATPLVAGAPAAVTVDEGSPATASGTYEAGSAAPMAFSATTGTVTTSGGNRGTWTWTARPDDGPRDGGVVTVTADNGVAASASFRLDVRNAAPTAVLEAPGTAFTDRPFTLAVRDLTDPSAADRAAGIDVALDCGDGSGYAAAGTTLRRSCAVDRGGRRTVRARIADRDGGVLELDAVVAVYSAEGDGAPDRSAAGTVGPRGSVSTGDGEATPSDPLVTRVRVPSGGDVSIEEGPARGESPADHVLLDWGATVDAPRQTVDAPLEVTFRLDGDLLPRPVPGSGELLVTPARGGDPILPCGDGGGADGGLPCVARRGTSGDDLVLLVRTVSGGAFAFATPTRACPAVGVPTGSFADTRGTAHETAIACAEWWGLVRGVVPGSYHPDGPVSRGQVASMVARVLTLAGARMPSDPPDRFSDDDGSVHEPAIRQLAELGVMQGRDEGTFAPRSPLTRAQFASTLARASSVLLGPLPDGPDRFRDDDGTVHEANIDAVAAAGLANGVDADRFAPHDAVRRDQTASFLTRLLDAWYVGYRD